MKVRTMNNISVITPHGWLMGGAETDDFGRTISRLLDEGHANILIDLRDTEMMNSTALSVVSDCHSRCEKRGGRMALCNIDRRIDMVLVVTRLALRFNAYPTLQAALESFTAGAET